MNSPLRYILTLVVLFLIAGCKKDPVEIPVNNFVHFPIGQKCIHENSLTVEADSVIRDFSIYHDDYGGRWVRIAFDKLNKNSIVKINFLTKSGPLISLHQAEPVPEMWQSQSDYIDSKHPTIIEKSRHLTNGIKGLNNKAKNIQLFVSNYLDFRIYKDSGLVSASSTLSYQYGTCINYSRLFVALCRAADIPARTVWGCVYHVNSFEGHHNWAEFVDEDGNWHSLDYLFTVDFNLNNIRYLDLMYAPEQNRYFQDYQAYRIANNGDYFFYDGSPNAVDGKLNVDIVSNNYPDEMELSMSYAISKVFENK